MIKRKHRQLSFVLSVILIAAGCSARLPITRDTEPESRPEVEILSGHTALIRTADCDISVLHLSETQWILIQENIGLRSRKASGVLPYPPGELFFIIVSNTSEHNLTGITAACVAGNISNPMIPSSELPENYRTEADIADLCDQLFAVRRLLSFEHDLEKIDLVDDTLLQPFPFILPLDKTCFVAAFPPLPIDIRAYTVSISYSLSSRKKTVDFRFNRIEHRDEE